MVFHFGLCSLNKCQHCPGGLLIGQWCKFTGQSSPKLNLTWKMCVDLFAPCNLIHHSNFIGMNLFCFKSSLFYTLWTSLLRGSGGCGILKGPRGEWCSVAENTGHDFSLLTQSIPTVCCVFLIMACAYTSKHEVQKNIILKQVLSGIVITSKQHMISASEKKGVFFLFCSK